MVYLHAMESFLTMKVIEEERRSLLGKSQGVWQE